MEEIWKDVPEYEGLYQVSTYGNVKSLDRYVRSRWGTKKPVKGHLLKAEKTIHGYLQVSLCKPGLSRKRYKVHRLVAMAFIPNPQNLPQVNHKDEDKTNNRLDNLEWCDGFYNQRYGTCSERKHIKLINHPLKSIKVEQLTKDGEHIDYYPSAKEAARQTGICQGNISCVCCGRHSLAGGYKWKYIV